MFESEIYVNVLQMTAFYLIRRFTVNSTFESQFSKPFSIKKPVCDCLA